MKIVTAGGSLFLPPILQFQRTDKQNTFSHSLFFEEKLEITKKKYTFAADNNHLS